MRHSLTLRLTLFFAVVSTAVLIAVGYLVGTAVERHFVELDRADLEAKSELVRHLFAKIRSPAELGEVAPRLEAVLIGQMDVFVRVAGARERD